ncbi:MAG: class I SAM-dependent methyltransferase [Candidatus Scalindua sp.]
MDICKCCGYKFTSIDQTLILEDGWKIVFCPQCQIGFTCLATEYKIEREKLLQDTYSLRRWLEVYFGRKIEFNRRYEQCLSIILSHGPITSVLDVGCGLGYWLYFLREKGIEHIVGIEINDEFIKAGQEIFDIKIQKSMQNINRTFDVISFNDVLEHLHDPVSLLTQTFPLSHSKTLYYIQSPNYQSNMAKWLHKKWPWWTVPDHLWHFSPTGISKLLDKAGLRVIELKTCDSMYEIVEYVLPECVRPFFRPLKYIHRTSSYFYNRSNKGSLIQLVAKRK